MKYKLILLLLLIGLNTQAQKVALNKKSSTITIDGKDVFKYSKKALINWSFFDLNDNEIIFFSVVNNGTNSHTTDDYYIVNFINENVKVESNNYAQFQTFFNFNKAIVKFVEWLLKEKVIDSKGIVNPDKLSIFQSKYDQNISNRTIFH